MKGCHECLSGSVIKALYFYVVELKLSLTTGWIFFGGFPASFFFLSRYHVSLMQNVFTAVIVFIKAHLSISEWKGFCIFISHFLGKKICYSGLWKSIMSFNLVVEEKE